MSIMTWQSIKLKALGTSLVFLGIMMLYSAWPASEEAPVFTVPVAVASADDTIRQAFTVSPGGLLDLSTDRGQISVVTGDDDELRVEVERRARSSERARAFDVEFEQDDDVVRVKGKTEERSGWFGTQRGPEVHFRIHVPRTYNLNLETEGGTVRIDDLAGDIDARTAGGSITIGEIDGSVMARTAGGSIALAGIRGDASLRTSGGSIKIDAVEGNAEVRTAGGSITLGSVSGTIDGRTSGGSITAGVIHDLQGESSLETAGGGLRVGLATGANLLIDASTSVGKISANLDLPIDEGWTSSQMEGQIGEGGPLLRLRTAAGSITVERK